jgi:Glycosyl transferases group 1
MLPDVGILALVPDTWSMVWQVRHQILVRLSRYFHVAWVNPAVDWRASLHPRARLDGPCFIGPPGFRVYSAEAWLPKFYRPAWLAEFTSRLRVRRARSILTRAGCKEILLSVWRPEFADAVRYLPSCRSCYHIDDEYSFSDVEMPMSEQERALIAHVDQVFVSSQGLRLRKGDINRHTVFVPNGVDYRAYAAAHPEPEDLAKIPRPRIGYTGLLKRQLDWPLLQRLSERQPAWSFVFVGPVQEDPETRSAVRSLATRPNVYFLGCKPTHELPPYPQHFDACIMPYRLNDYTRYIYPLKLHEYLATGRPSVGAPIPSLERFADVVTLACGIDGWVSALEHALSAEANRAERRSARRAVARTHDWEHLVQHVARVLAERLGPPYVERLESALAQNHGGADDIRSRRVASSSH